MEAKKVNKLKIFVALLFSAAVLAMYFYVIFKGDVEGHYLTFACIGASFLLSLIFISLKSKKWLITLALALNVAADYFLVLKLDERNKLIGLSIFCAIQFVYALYTLCLNGSIATKVINLALRVGLCLVVYFILPVYFTMGIIELMACMYIVNFFVTLLVLLCHLKTEWLMFLGMLLFFACDIFVGLTNGAIELFNITGPFVEILTKYDIAFYCYIPGVLLVSLSSVFYKKKD